MPVTDHLTDEQAVDELIGMSWAEGVYAEADQKDNREKAATRVAMARTEVLCRLAEFRCTMNARGYFGIGIQNGKTKENLGTLWRGAYQLGASFIFTIGQRHKRQASDTYKSWQHIPLYRYTTFQEFYAALPYSCQLVAIEQGGVDLSDFEHPSRAVYLLGAEDHGLTKEALQFAIHRVSLGSVRQNSYNVAQAGTLVMYDRYQKGEHHERKG